MLETVVLVLHFSLDEGEDFLVVVNTLVDLWVFALDVLILDEVLLHVSNHVGPIHVSWIEVSDLSATAIHLVDACCHHAVPSSGGLSL